MKYVLEQKGSEKALISSSISQLTEYLLDYIYLRFNQELSYMEQYRLFRKLSEKGETTIKDINYKIYKVEGYLNVN